jgi:hypothetical protein
MTDRNSYKKWTPEEDEFLRNLVLANVSPFDIARHGSDDRYPL